MITSWIDTKIVVCGAGSGTSRPKFSKLATLSSLFWEEPVLGAILWPLEHPDGLSCPRVDYLGSPYPCFNYFLGSLPGFLQFFRLLKNGS